MKDYVVGSSNVVDKLKKSDGRKKATYSMHHSAYLEMNWQHILLQNTTMVILLYLTWETKGLKYSNIWNIMFPVIFIDFAGLLILRHANNNSF